MKKLLLGPVVFPNDLHARARAVNRVWTVSNGSFLARCPRARLFSDNFGHSDCVILRESCKVADLRFCL